MASNSGKRGPHNLIPTRHKTMDKGAAGDSTLHVRMLVLIQRPIIHLILIQRHFIHSMVHQVWLLSPCDLCVRGTGRREGAPAPRGQKAMLDPMYAE